MHMQWLRPCHPPFWFFRRVVRSNAKMHEFFVANINFPPTPPTQKNKYHVCWAFSYVSVCA